MIKKTLIKNCHYLFISLLIIKLLSLIALDIDNSRFFASDSYQYIESAKTIIQFGTFSHSLEQPEIPELIRTPGYPIFIAAIFSIFGQNVKILILFQIILSIFSILIFYKILIELFHSQRIALFGSLIFFCDPISYSLNYYVLTETLFQFLIISFIYFGNRLIKNEKSFSNFILLGLILATAILVRPIAQFIFVSMLIGLSIYLFILKYHFSKVLKHLLTFSIPIIICVGGWMVRNNHVSERFVLSNMSAINVFHFKAPGVLSVEHEIPLEKAQQQIIGNINMWDYVGKHPSSEKINDWSEKSISIIGQNPLSFIKIMGIGITNTLFGPGDGQFYSLLGYKNIRNGPLGDILRLPRSQYGNKWLFDNPSLFVLFIWAVGYLLFLYIGLAISIFRVHILDENKLSFLFIGLLLLYFILFSGGLETNYRFRAPMIPMLIIFSLPGLLVIYKSVQNKILTIGYKL